MSIFTKIIAGELPAYKIAENDKYLALLDIFPATDGHTIVVPKVEVDRLFDLPDDYLDGYLTFCKPIARAIQRAFGANRVNIITIGFEVPHAHIHLVPMNTAADADILSHKLKPTPEALTAVQEKILGELAVGS